MRKKITTERKKSKEAWNAKKKVKQAAYLAAYKTARGCVDCGYRKHAAALDFDHVRGEKTTCVGWLVHCSRARLDAEIAKCEIVCANCHRVRTFERRRLAKLLR